MKISYILPVYKVEAYLRECVNSITKQIKSIPKEITVKNVLNIP